MKLFCKCESEKTITINDVIQHLKTYSDDAIKEIVEAVKLYREADRKRDLALEEKLFIEMEDYNEN